MDMLTPNVTERGSDMWAERGRPAADQARLAFGPTEAASGTGATDMTNQYSTPGPQTGRTDRSTALGALLDQIRSLMQTPGAKTVQPADSYLGKCDIALKSAKTALRLASIATIEGDAAARRNQVAEANGFLGKATAFLKAKAEMEDTEDEDGAEDDDDVESRAAKIKSLLLKAQGLASDTGNGAAGSPIGGQPGMSVEQFLNGIASAGSVRKSDTDAVRMPPDLFKSMPSVSISEKIEAALDAGTLTPDEATVAEARLSALNLAKAGRIPMAEVMAQLTDSSTPAGVRAIFGVESVPGSVRMVA
jgi:hypothetical protein